MQQRMVGRAALHQVQIPQGTLIIVQAFAFCVAFHGGIGALHVHSLAQNIRAVLVIRSRQRIVFDGLGVIFQRAVKHAAAGKFRRQSVKMVGKEKAEHPVQRQYA